jgi:hypothetical protein
MALGLLEVLGSLVGSSYSDFSSTDMQLSRRASAAIGRPIPIYLVTATQIKRYSNWGQEREQTWDKPAPRNMR